jgi:invasion protein IalB
MLRRRCSFSETSPISSGLVTAIMFMGIFGGISVFPAMATNIQQITPSSGNAIDSTPTAGSAEKFGDWYVRCVAPNHGPRTCEIAQVAQVMREEKSVNVLTIAVAAAVKSARQDNKKNSQPLTLTALVPLNVGLQAGLSIAAEGKSVAKLAYRNCNQAGCWAELPLRPAMLSTLSKGSSGEASLRLVDGQDVKIRFSLKGLRAAVAALQDRQSK